MRRKPVKMSCLSDSFARLRLKADLQGSPQDSLRVSHRAGLQDCPLDNHRGNRQVSRQLSLQESQADSHLDSLRADLQGILQGSLQDSHRAGLQDSPLDLSLIHI